MTRRHYPASPRSDATAELAGVAFPDPYQWLEADSEEVGAWERAQNELSTDYVKGWEHWGELKDLLASASANGSADPVAVPVAGGGRWFRLSDSGNDVIVSAEPLGDPSTTVPIEGVTGEAGAPAVLWMNPSPDGHTLAVGLCPDGSEQTTISLYDVRSGKRISDSPPHVLHDEIAGWVSWLPDSRSFFYLGCVGRPVDFKMAVFQCHLANPAESEQQEIPGIGLEHNYTYVQCSTDGKWAVAVHRWSNPLPIAIRDLADPSGAWRPFLHGTSATVCGQIVGDAYVAVTDESAPRGRVVRIPLDTDDPNDPGQWTELVGESEAVLRWVLPVGDVLYLAELVDTYNRLRIVSRDGRYLGAVPLPGNGSLLHEFTSPFTAMRRDPSQDSLIFGFSTLTTSWGLYRHWPEAEELECLSAPGNVLNATVEDLWATAPDGARVPYHVVRPASVEPGECRPALLHAYGAFNCPLTPEYPGAMWTVVESGGYYVHAHIRGGGDLGRDWWDGGRGLGKQNGYSDLYAVAEDLIERGISSPRQLGLMGESNGGLMCGVAVTQRPDLWRVVVPRIPMFDLIRGCEDEFGLLVMEEYADITLADEVRRLATFSPQHLIRDEASYPAVYIDGGVNDVRCPSWHGRKFAAALQSAPGCELPVLLRLWENVGHGCGTNSAIAKEQDACWLAFLFMELGLIPARR